MSAKHKRPFYVFAVVAAMCSLVLVTGIRTSGGRATGAETAATAYRDLPAGHRRWPPIDAGPT